MKVKGVRLYGVKDIRLEEFEIPEIAEDEILLQIECNGIAMSTLKEITLAQRHLRVPKNIKKHPVLIGHEFSGRIAKVGAKWKDNYRKENNLYWYRKFLTRLNHLDILIHILVEQRHTVSYLQM